MGSGEHTYYQSGIRSNEGSHDLFILSYTLELHHQSVSYGCIRWLFPLLTEINNRISLMSKIHESPHLFTNIGVMTVIQAPLQNINF